MKPKGHRCRLWAGARRILTGRKGFVFENNDFLRRFLGRSLTGL